MEANTGPGRSIHPLAWAAGIAVIVFSAVGVGAMMGWIPNSMGGPNDATAIESKSAAVSAPKAAPRQAQAVQHAAPIKRQPETPIVHSPAPVAAIKCAECGIVESVDAVQAKGAGSGLGAVGGAVLGAIVGNQVGGGHGKDAMTVIGAVGGGLAGNEVEKRVKSTTSYTVTVRFEDGTSRVFSAAAASSWHVGDKVRIVDGVIRSNG